jgi:glutamate synthase domain-containing protein 3
MTVATFPAEIKTAEEAVKLAQEIERLEGVVKALKETLKKYVEETGQPVETVDQVWWWVESETWKFSPEKLKELCQEIAIEGHNPWDLLSITAANLKKIGWSDEALSRFGEKRVTRSFRPRKK